jgi:antitoxin component YwqK of YwqJK toxin-antitoxin module
VTYVGEWKDGMKHGQGAMYFPNGDIIVGKWARGVTDGPVSFQFNENSPWADPEY